MRTQRERPCGSHTATQALLDIVAWPALCNSSSRWSVPVHAVVVLGSVCCGAIPCCALCAVQCRGSDCAVPCSARAADPIMLRCALLGVDPPLVSRWRQCFNPCQKELGLLKAARSVVQVDHGMVWHGTRAMPQDMLGLQTKEAHNVAGHGLWCRVQCSVERPVTRAVARLSEM